MDDVTLTRSSSQIQSMVLTETVVHVQNSQMKERLLVLNKETLFVTFIQWGGGSSLRFV